MANFTLLLLTLFLTLITLTPSGAAISSCNGPCQDLNDCDDQLICIEGKCNDDPQVGTHICSGGTTPSPQPDGCNPSGTLPCQGQSYPTYDCLPPVVSSTPSKLTNNNFRKGGDGGAASKCDDSYHSNDELIVALSTGWYNDGSRTRCGNIIQITANNGKSMAVKVVDKCDSRHRCDEEHAGQLPCQNNIVDGSNAVWSALGLNRDDGEVDITWSMA